MSTPLALLIFWGMKLLASRALHDVLHSRSNLKELFMALHHTACKFLNLENIDSDQLTQ